MQLTLSLMNAVEVCRRQFFLLIIVCYCGSILCSSLGKSMENFRVYTVTYNVGTSNPSKDLHDMLSLSPKPDKNSYDLYAVSLQEVKAQPQNMLLDVFFEDPWTDAVKTLLEARDYVKIKSVRLQGLILSIFCLKKHLINLRQIESEYTRTGLSGMWGNKGAVAIRLSIYGVSLCFVNAHLSAHDHQLKNRIEDYDNIMTSQTFHIREQSAILFHDYVFWMGDLNFRINEDVFKTPAEVEALIKNGELKKLYENDQLYTCMRKGDAFSQFTEQPPTFPPTFKFEVGSSDYDHKRRPAWCDRILYRVSPHNYQNVTLHIEQKSYKSHPSYQLSDHRPVSANFVIKVFSHFEETVVKFDRIPFWYTDEENSATFKVTQPLQCCKNDWIGVFKDKFSSLEDYMMYEYVSKASTPVPEAQGASSAQAPPSFTPNMKQTITFPEIKTRSRGLFRLIYFSLDEDNVQSILGVSDPFPLQEKESSSHDSSSESSSSY
ncbi:phosphatidylinositol 4,5-bisphosphate 5-phosphatase A isoform X2 [Agrilus planipennis]|uniref:Phosphatidylinositol 4,5-bisphosphate 5-phosphatase A isoform X2 n=1 Tax=Agrilus planipennis TaxID=224129 RepID=A0A1W4WZT6_AGRPL|nr:phosphatidylinositol 4,5-bisphosphate 5-phosphatase A isoform X2 [Agrilus planipennis]